MWEEYILHIDGMKSIRCNYNHLFETSLGWVSAIEMVGKGDLNILTKYGYRKGYVIATGETIPIVDIAVNHPNHRYYTEEVSSHNTGGGKSLTMSHMAAGHLLAGYNVLYITMEMAEHEIARRIDANILDVDMKFIGQSTPKEFFNRKIDNIKSKTLGRLFIKEFPTAAAGVGHFRALLNELKIKKQFIPDIIYIDYLNICISVRSKMSNSGGMYSYVKSIAEEIRGLAVEFNVPIVSATQTNREGFSSSDPGLENTSESFGLPATSDLFLVIISSEELDRKGQIMFKQLKNRYNDIVQMRRFVVGINRSKMRLYDLEESERDDVISPEDIDIDDHQTINSVDIKNKLLFG